MTEREVFQFYNDYVKIIYSEIEAKRNSLPVELLFEVHSAFDHLKRTHIDKIDEDTCCKKAYSHLKRGVLDAFKLKLKYFNDDCEILLKSKLDLKLIDNGKYLTLFMQKRNDIIKIAKQARLSESNEDIDVSFNLWTEASEKINEFEDSFFDDGKIMWAKRQSFLHFGRDFILGIITGVISSILVSIIIA